MAGRLPGLLDADEVEAALSAWVAPAALDPQVVARAAARRRPEKQERDSRPARRHKPPDAQALRETRDDGQVRAAPGHPWLDRDPNTMPPLKRCWLAVVKMILTRR